MSRVFDAGDMFGRRPTGRTTGAKRPRALVPTLVLLVILALLFSVFTNLWTERLWFDSIGFSQVFSTVLLTRTGLFIVFGVLLAVVVVGNAWLAHRLRPGYRPESVEQQSLDRYREAVDPIGRWLLVGLGVVLAVFAGSAASSEWSTYLSWRHGTDFGSVDAQFGEDIGFFVFDYPWLRFLLTYGFAVVLLSLVAAAVTHYLYGGIRLQTRAQRATDAAQVHLSVLLGLFVLLKAVAYWYDRYGLTTSESELFTGISYTDANAVIPGKQILAVIALICALLFFANIVRRTWILPGIGLGLLVLSAVLLGGVWPAIVQQFQVNPTKQDLEAQFIDRNIEATREAFEIADVKVTRYNATSEIRPTRLRDDAAALPGIRLVDPTIVGQTFEQLQQVRGFYSFPRSLDVDRYDINGERQDVIVALREVDLSGLPEHDWNNDHTVYTHGFGMVAAFGDQVTEDGEPVYAERDIPPVGALPIDQPRVYFGELSPTYSIVGAPEGAPQLELDIPDTAGAGGQPTNFTYDGLGGVPMGSLFRELLYALKFQEPNIVLSGRVNEASRILYDRSPRERVSKVAPWLTLDGDPYPAVVDGRIVWIIDGYTTSNGYPQSQLQSLDEATDDSLTTRRAVIGQIDKPVNYIRNSVKAVVDAYDGTVDLYEWDQNDPVLATWRKVFPDAVQDKEAIPPDLLDHFRYPEDLFKVQREMLARYHVTNAGVFYQNADRWEVPVDPTLETAAAKQPPYYLTVRMPGQARPAFSLTSVYEPYRRDNLASFVAVDSEASGNDYGTLRVLRLPGNTAIDGPGLVANAFNADPDVANALLPFRTSGAQAIFGNLLTLPMGDGLLYVQPVYTIRGEGTGTYPLQQLVLVAFGDEVGVGDTLAEALDSVFGGAATQPPDTPPDGPNPPTPTGPINPQVAALLAEAEALITEAERDLLRTGDLGAYQDAVDEAGRLLRRAVALQQRPDEGSAGTPSPTGGAGGATPTDGPGGAGG